MSGFQERLNKSDGPTDSKISFITQAPKKNELKIPEIFLFNFQHLLEKFEISTRSAETFQNLKIRTKKISETLEKYQFIKKVKLQGLNT